MINAVVIIVGVDEASHDEFVKTATKQSVRIEEVTEGSKHVASAITVPYELKTYEVFKTWESFFNLV